MDRFSDLSKKIHPEKIPPLFQSCFYLQKTFLEDILNTSTTLDKSQLFILTIFFTIQN